MEIETLQAVLYGEYCWGCGAHTEKGEMVCGSNGFCVNKAGKTARARDDFGRPVDERAQGMESRLVFRFDT